MVLCASHNTGTGLGGIHDIGQAKVDRVRSARESCKSVETSCDDLELAKKINAHVPVPAKNRRVVVSPKPRIRFTDASSL